MIIRILNRKAFPKMAAKKVLVTGASGLLGREIIKCFKKEGWDVLGTAYSRVKEDLVKVDLKDSAEIAKIFSEFRPNAVVHSAAERRPDNMGKDPEGARLLNVTSTEIITKLCSEYNAFLLYISTDYVFDGANPPYKPGDTTNPLNAYGETKRDGETMVKRYHQSAILRVPILYGNVETIDESAVTVIYKAICSGKPSQISDYEIRFPTHTTDVANVVERISSSARPGVWHFSSADRYTKYGMACVMGRVLGVGVAHLEPVKGPSGGAPRPYNTQLESSATFEAFDYQPKMCFDKVIHDILKPFSVE